jgi:hypothetical protein
VSHMCQCWRSWIGTEIGHMWLSRSWACNARNAGEMHLLYVKSLDVARWLGADKLIVVVDATFTLNTTDF